MTISSNSVLITGVSGFIGKNIANYFIDQGWKVFGIDVLNFDSSLSSRLSGYYRLKLPAKKFNKIIKELLPSVVIHCAGPASVAKSISSPEPDFYSSTVVMFEVLNSLKTYSPESKFIFLSSAAVYGNPSSIPVSEDQSTKPISPYGYHKLQCELLCEEYERLYSLPVCIVRIFSAYGQGLRRQVVWDICNKAMNDNDIILHGNGNESRDFVHIIDIVKALFLLAGSDKISRCTVNLASGREVKISELASLILSEFKLNKNIKYNGIVPSGDPINWKADISKIKNFGYLPSYSIEQGVKEYVEWFLINKTD